MERTFRADKMLARVEKQGLTHLLDDGLIAEIKKMDGHKGNDYNWASVVRNEPLVWMEEFNTYVALCDCD